MGARTKDMWWGTAIEAPDPSALAAFYSKLLDWPIAHEEPGTCILAAPQGSIYIVFQQAEGYVPPVWPPVEGQQRTMMHLDFQVGDLSSAVADAVALGAKIVAYQPQDNVRVLLDPAGRPFCLCRDDEA
jgi:predicted enzyme related to lactoylglutathione lyase